MRSCVVAALAAMINTLRHLKLWKRRGSAGTTDGRARVGAGTTGSNMFRSPSSDSGYSDVQTTLAVRPAAQATAARRSNAGVAPSPVELLPASRSGVDCPAIRVTAPPVSPAEAPPPPLPVPRPPSVVDQRRSGVDAVAPPLPRSRRSAPLGTDRLRTVSEHGSMDVCVLRQQEMVSVETFFDFVKRRDVDSIQYALRDAHFDVDSQDAVSQLSFLVVLSVNEATAARKARDNLTTISLKCTQIRRFAYIVALSPPLCRIVVSTLKFTFHSCAHFNKIINIIVWLLLNLFGLLLYL